MRRPTRSLALGCLLIVGVIGFLIYQGISNNLVYYITPGELVAKGAAAQGQNFRLGGQVRPGSVEWNPSTHFLRFVLQDNSVAGPRQRVTVVSHTIPPQLFFIRGVGCVVEGDFINHVFAASNLMIKHSNTYRAPKPGQTPVPDNQYIPQAGQSASGT